MSVSRRPRLEPQRRPVGAVHFLAGPRRCCSASRLAGALSGTRTDLFFDEAQYWAWSEEPAFGYYSKPPLIAWIIGAATDGVRGRANPASACPRRCCTRRPRSPSSGSGAGSMTRASARSAALAFATLPGVSLSAGLISTDVPLLLCWALALVGFAALFETDEAVAGAAARRRLRRRAQCQVRHGLVRRLRRPSIWS